MKSVHQTLRRYPAARPDYVDQVIARLVAWLDNQMPQLHEGAAP